MKKSSPTIYPLFLVFTLLLSPPSTAVALLRSPSELPLISAEKLIRDLNLFPNEPINIVDGDSPRHTPRLMEKRFRLPNLVDSDGVSVEDLGHHAGYYKIDHSHSARFDFINTRLKHFSIRNSVLSISKFCSTSYL